MTTSVRFSSTAIVAFSPPDWPLRIPMAPSTVSIVICVPSRSWGVSMSIAPERRTATVWELDGSIPSGVPPGLKGSCWNCCTDISVFAPRSKVIWLAKSRLTLVPSVVLTVAPLATM